MPCAIYNVQCTKCNLQCGRLGGVDYWPPHLTLIGCSRGGEHPCAKIWFSLFKSNNKGGDGDVPEGGTNAKLVLSLFRASVNNKETMMLGVEITRSQNGISISLFTGRGKVKQIAKAVEGSMIFTWNYTRLVLPPGHLTLSICSKCCCNKSGLRKAKIKITEINMFDINKLPYCAFLV